MKTKSEKAIAKKAYYEKNKVAILAKRKIYYTENKESISEKDKLRHKKNKAKETEEMKAARKQYRKLYHEENRECENKKNKLHYEKNKEAISKQRKIYRDANREELNRKERERNNTEEGREKSATYIREFRRTPIGKTTSFIRDSLRRVVRLLKQDKQINSMTSVGYTPLELKDHLEALFDVGMSWDNYGDWHIDHIVSLSVLVHRNRDLPQGELMLIVNRLDNLQPLWAGDNLRKNRY